MQCITARSISLNTAAMQVDHGKSRALQGFRYWSREIVSEYKGTLNGIPLRSIVAVNKSAKVFVGQLSEIHVSITGNPNDYAVEVASNAWFGSLVWPALAGLAIGGPVGLAAGTAAGGTAGLAAGTAVGGIVAYEFERKMWKHVQEAVKKVSQVQPTLESVDTYHH